MGFVASVGKFEALYRIIHFGKKHNMLKNRLGLCFACFMSSTVGAISAFSVTFLLVRINSCNCSFGTMRNEDIYVYLNPNM